MRATWANVWEQALADEAQRRHPLLTLRDALLAEADEQHRHVSIESRLRSMVVALDEASA